MCTTMVPQTRGLQIFLILLLAVMVSSAVPSSAADSHHTIISLLLPARLNIPLFVLSCTTCLSD